MDQTFGSKTCGLSRRTTTVIDEEEEEEEEEEEDEYCLNRVSTPLIVPEMRERRRRRGGRERQENQQQFQILAVFVAALRKSLVTCGVEKEEVTTCGAMDISPPTDVKHVSHVTFDPFNGFLGLPVEFQPKIPRRVPSASTRVFGVSAESMKCSYDQRGNSVPTILLMMQKRLFLEGGLQTEGIFRITADNTQEEYVRDQLNKGVVQHGIDVHCLAGLIKAWFRELPKGVLDSLTPDQVVNCNTEEDCMLLIRLLQPTEAALLDWAINLMADVVQHENDNKMNARNIAMVFAPNMTQMADPLTALIHAVQVMNLVKTLILKTIRERGEMDPETGEHSPSYPNNTISNSTTLGSEIGDESRTQTVDDCGSDTPPSSIFLRSITMSRLESDAEESSWNFHKSEDHCGQLKSISGNNTPINCNIEAAESESSDGFSRDAEGFLDRLSFKKGVRRLRKHPVFQLSKSFKKPAELNPVDTKGALDMR